ncbi:type 1 glutamine amidotransferase [Sphingomonas sp. Leaf20]|uniref:type 1 glutamine amidotransferase n=1 Tax=Sphingomonas sp. Leaf20 TaxID=1735685 RepID=UPI0006F2F3DF|nr:type 1 glutamine amidotransferase [Sphingomonas sp. Leaf20]KQM73922.1 glutamine amidotransferase [Sphingomonas sp. Leaf20]
MPHFLVAESETADQRDARRRHAGKSSGETYAATLEQLRPDARITIVAPADDDADQLDAAALRAFDAVFVTGSPLHVYDDSPPVRRQLAFMRAVFASGTPSFGSCAGLQLAVAAAGGSVRKMPERIEAGVARRITATADGRAHPLLAGRAPSWDAPAIHGDEVEQLPDDATLLASNAVTRIQAAEIRHDGGVFWGVQYHPELAPREIAIALRRQADDLIEAGLAETQDDVERRAAELDALHDSSDRRSLLWALGVDREFAHEASRRLELTNFLDHFTPSRARDAGAD